MSEHLKDHIVLKALSKCASDPFISKDAIRFSLITHLLLRCLRSHVCTEWAGDVRNLKPGQIWCTLEQVSGWVGCDKGTVSRHLKKLHSGRVLVLESLPRYGLIITLSLLADNSGEKHTDDAPDPVIVTTIPTNIVAIKPAVIVANNAGSAAPKNPLRNPPSSDLEGDTTTSASDFEVTAERIKAAWEVWNETRESFKIPKTNISPLQESSLARAIRGLGYANVLLALEGQRHEEKTDTFRPVQHLSVDRVLHRDGRGQSRWEKFVNMALAARAKSDTDEDLEKKARGET